MLHYTPPTWIDREHCKKIDKKIREGVLTGRMSNYERLKLEESKIIGSLSSFERTYMPPTPW